VDPSQPGEGSALLEVSEAVKKSGQYDMWSVQANATLDAGTKVKAPNVPHPRTAIAVPAVPAPHAGTSYNPPESAHTALLCAAHEAELRRVEKSEALEATKMRILAARQADGGGDGGAEGMLIDKPEEAAPSLTRVRTGQRSRAILPASKTHLLRESLCHNARPSNKDEKQRSYVPKNVLF